MPRFARRESLSSIYHVIVRGVSRQIIFEDDGDRAFFMSRVVSYRKEFDGELLAWCLMDNHVHLLLKMPFTNLSRFMHALLTDYAGYFNRVHGRTGPLFEGRFKSEPVESDEYLMTVVRYIHRNPVKAKMTDGPSYPWSSYDEYCDGKDGWVQTGFVLGVFGSKTEFLKFHGEDEDDSCLEVPDLDRRRLPDEEALHIAEEVLGNGIVGHIKAMPRNERNAALAALKESGLSVRQIQRLTGISLGTISNAGK